MFNKSDSKCDNLKGTGINVCIAERTEIRYFSSGDVRRPTVVYRDTCTLRDWKSFGMNNYYVIIFQRCFIDIDT